MQHHHTCTTTSDALDGVIQTWQGPFYTLSLDNSRWLSYYSHMLDLVEIGSSFDRIPNAFISKELVINLFSGIKNQLYNNR